MSKGAHDIFVVIVNFISNDLEVKHVIIGLFEVTNTLVALQWLLDYRNYWIGLL
jgi:hypothetical protein